MKFLITIIIFLIMLMFLIYINREYKSKVFLLFSFLLVFLVILAYFTKPFPTDDLQFYYNLMDEMKIKGLEWTLFSSPYKYTILINMYLYIFSLIGNYQLLPAVTIFIVYIIIFYIYSYYFNRTSRFNMSILILILFSLLFLDGIFLE